jgi:hypothetical protein
LCLVQVSCGKVFKACFFYSICLRRFRQRSQSHEVKQLDSTWPHASKFVESILDLHNHTFYEILSCNASHRQPSHTLSCFASDNWLTLSGLVSIGSSRLG